MKKTIIYCRVSSIKQVKEGHGLESQEHRCREYAKTKGYSVIKVFKDEGISGAEGNRPGFNALLAFLDNYQEGEVIVLIDEPSRLARDMRVHLALRKSLSDRKVGIECPNFVFDDSIEGRLVENVTAAVNQYGREQNARQVKNRMRARLASGFYCFKSPPPGYYFKATNIYGKVLMKDEPTASVYKEALECYEKGLINSPVEVQEMIIKGFKTYGLPRKIALDTVIRLMQNIFITGHVKYEPWDIGLSKGYHEPIISLSTFNSIQEKLHKKQNAPMRKDYSVDFPLRGFVICPSCNRPMTASWHKGRAKKYPHYFCNQKNCERRNKNILTGKMEQSFEGLVKDIKPNQDTLNLAKGVFLDIWERRDMVEEDNKQRLRKRIVEIEENKQKLLGRIVGTENPEMVAIYEKEITKLEKEKEDLTQRMPAKIYSDESFGTGYERVFSVLENPVLMWQSENHKDRRLLLEMFFDDKIAYDLETGFGTADLALLPKLLCARVADKNGFVEMPGVEPGCKKAISKDFIASLVLYFYRTGLKLFVFLVPFGKLLSWKPQPRVGINPNLSASD